MRINRRFINFALISTFIVFLGSLIGCKGRTIDNVEPTGDTIEVVIMQDTNLNTTN